MKRKILSLSLFLLLAAFPASAADLPAPPPAAATQPASHARHGKKSRKKHHRKHRQKGTAPAPARPQT